MLLGRDLLFLCSQHVSSAQGMTDTKVSEEGHSFPMGSTPVTRVTSQTRAFDSRPLLWDLGGKDRVRESWTGLSEEAAGAGT